MRIASRFRFPAAVRIPATAGLALVCISAASGCAARAKALEVVRLPPLELPLSPSGKPLLAWPTSTPPAPVDAFYIPRHLRRLEDWRVLADYCIESSGRVTPAGTDHLVAEMALTRRIRGWTFAPWSSEHEEIFCESAMVYDNEDVRGRHDRSTMILYIPIVPPSPHLPADGSLEQVPARMLHDEASDLSWGYAATQQGNYWSLTYSTMQHTQATWWGYGEVEGGFGEITFGLCVDGDGHPSHQSTDIDLDWLAPEHQTWLASGLEAGRDAARFAPRLERGVPTQDCDVEIRYAVWVIDHELLLNYNSELDELMLRELRGDPTGPWPGDLEPWAAHGPVLAIDGGRAPRMIATPSWLPPYELATTMPADMPIRTVRARFCVPVAGGHPTEVRVLESDAVGQERAVLRLVAEGVARWRAGMTEGVDEPSICGEVEWQIGRRPWEPPSAGR